MPLRVVFYRGERYGSECPLGKFKLYPPCTGVGAYTADPVEKCLECNFSDITQEKFDLEKICHCPADMTYDDYDELRKKYATTKGKKTKTGFWEFVKTHYTSKE